jgi:hypothetical protein
MQTAYLELKVPKELRVKRGIQVHKELKDYRGM